LENREGTNDEMFRRMWKEVDNKTNKARMAKAERKKGKKNREKKKEFRKPIVEEEMKITRVIKEKKEKEEDLIEIRIVKKIVSRRFYEYLKVFEKKKSERMLTRKIWDYAIDIREGFVPKKGEDISIVKNRKRGSTGVCEGSVEKGVY